jgi:hypothetical protein
MRGGDRRHTLTEQNDGSLILLCLTSCTNSSIVFEDEQSYFLEVFASVHRQQVCLYFILVEGSRSWIGIVKTRGESYIIGEEHAIYKVVH